MCAKLNLEWDEVGPVLMLLGNATGVYAGVSFQSWDLGLSISLSVIALTSSIIERYDSSPAIFHRISLLATFATAVTVIVVVVLVLLTNFLQVDTSSFGSYALSAFGDGESLTLGSSVTLAIVGLIIAIASGKSDVSRLYHAGLTTSLIGLFISAVVVWCPLLKP